MASSEATLSLVLKARNLASREVDGLHRSLGKLHGVLTTLGKVGILAVVTALVGLGAALGDAMKRAAEEEVNIKKLDAALKANVKGFNGNTDAIEAVISKREDLAFSDDELRGSLATLVTKFHDVKTAQDVQATAMDVARLKGISLADATLLVSKGMDGSAKVLKQLGIELPKTATQQDRLAAIQKKAAGQATAYSKTAAGGQKAFQIAMDDVLEDVGKGFLPIMTEFFTILRVKVIPAVRDIIGRVQKWFAENKPLVDQITTFVKGVLGFMATLIGNVAAKLGELVAGISKSKPAMAILQGAFDVLKKTLEFIVDLLKQAWAAVEKLIDALTHLQLPDITGITDLIPHFATGGVAPGPRGHPVVAVLHGGEKVSSPGAEGKSGGLAGGFEAVAISKRDLARAMDQEMYFMLRRAAPAGGRI